MHELYDEQLDLVDADDQVIGMVNRSEIPRLLDCQHGFLRTACALLRNSAGEFWVPQRTSDKAIAPDGLDFAMAEHMGVGESYLEAAIRGFDEELNMAVGSDGLLRIGKLDPRLGVPYFTTVYLHETDETPDYNPKDFQGARWLPPEEIIAEIESGVPAKDMLVPAIKLVLTEQGRLR